MTADAPLAQPRILPGSQLLLALVAAGGLAAILAAGFSQDHLFRIQAYVIAAASVVFGFALNAGLSGGTLIDEPDKYQEGVIKAGVIATMFWAIVGMLVGVVIAAQLAWPNIFYLPDSGWPNFGRLAAAAHLGRDLRLRRQRPDRHVLLRRAAHQPRAGWPAASRPGSSSGAIRSSSCWRRLAT